MSHPGPIPNRWLHCPRMSTSLVADKFLAFKTPLQEAFKSSMSTEFAFTPDMLFGLMEKCKVKLGLWIDLTNTNRFYNRREVEDNKCLYKKLQCRGHGETPSMEQTKAFFELVDEFTETNPLDAIAVHCTHGFNRTGFLIVSYMVVSMDCQIEAALQMFAQVRPPGIYKQDYIRELYRRYDNEENAIPAPPLPAWCFEYDDSKGGEGESSGTLDEDDQPPANGAGTKRSLELGESSNGSGSNKKRKKAAFNENAVFMADVKGVKLLLDKDRVGELQHRIKEMCGSERTGFPGAQPVSMDMTNIGFLGQRPYNVSWKADGARYLMLIHKKDEIYFFDRDNSCFAVSGLTFPKQEDLTQHLTDTLLDGEMVIDEFDGKKYPRYLIYDVIYYANRNVKDEPFHKGRYNIVKNNIMVPRHEALKQCIINRLTEPFGVRCKEFWDITMSRYLLSDKFRKKLCHEPDGLIFQPALDPYKSGTCERVLKWKPIDQNSIDFRLVIGKESGVGMITKTVGYLHVGGMDQPYAMIKLNKNLKQYNNKIIECKYDKEWVFMRERKDKSFPNSYDTAKNVWESIRNPVTTDRLFSYIDNRRYRDDGELMPPPHSGNSEVRKETLANKIGILASRQRKKKNSLS